MKLDGYIRVSDVRGRSGESFISPEQQRDKIGAWAELHEHEIIAWEEDLDVSGGKLKRPGLDRIMGRIRSGQTDGIAIAKLDRFSRAGVGDALALIEEIKKLDAVFGCVEPQIDTTDPVMGEFVLTIFLALARMERQRIGANWSDARARATQRGRHMGRVPPFGYQKREDGKLEPHPVNGAVVTEIFERRAAGQSWRIIRDWLQSIGAVTTSGRNWATSALSEMVTNEVYLGVLQDKSSGVRIEGDHPPLTNVATWQAVQRKRGLRYSGGSTDGRQLLRGLVRCAGCRYSMVLNGNGEKVSYSCGRSAQAKDCPCPVTIRSNEYTRKGNPRKGLSAYVVEKVFERLPEIEAQAFGTDTEIEDLDAAAKAARAELTAWVSDPEIESRMGREAFMVGGESRRQAAEELERERDEALRRNAGRLQQPVRRLRDDWEQMTLDEQREALASLIQAVFVGPQQRRKAEEGASAERVHIVWFDDAPVDLPRQSRRDYVLRPFVFNGSDNPDRAGVALT